MGRSKHSGPGRQPDNPSSPESRAVEEATTGVNEYGAKKPGTSSNSTSGSSDSDSETSSPPAGQSGADQVSEAQGAAWRKKRPKSPGAQ